MIHARFGEQRDAVDDLYIVRLQSRYVVIYGADVSVNDSSSFTINNASHSPAITRHADMVMFLISRVMAVMRVH